MFSCDCCLQCWCHCTVSVLGRGGGSVINYFNTIFTGAIYINVIERGGLWSEGRWNEFLKGKEKNVSLQENMVHHLPGSMLQIQYPSLPAHSNVPLNPHLLCLKVNSRPGTEDQDVAMNLFNMSDAACRWKTANALLPKQTLYNTMMSWCNLLYKTIISPTLFYRQPILAHPKSLWRTA